MRGALPGLLTIAGRGCVAALALALVLHGSTKRPPAHRTAVSAPSAARTLTDEDFARGFVRARTGRGETHDFTPPANAVVCSDWRAFGAAEDWVYLSFTNWAFRVGANAAGRLRVHSFGRIEPLVRTASGAVAAGGWLAPLSARLGIVPEANWPLLGASGGPSQFWSAATPRGSLLLTWQNALLDRLASRPVSFQAELFPDGRFTYRYDLSRAGENAVHATVGARLAGGEWATNALPADVTTLEFHPLSDADRYDSDPDGDGLSTADELFLYGTDPHNPDTDYDGLTDGEELALGTDPLDPDSAGAAYGDGLAAKIGNLDPLSRPGHSTNTVLEHVFYSGTANGAFAYPQSDDGTAVLRIRVLGTGMGRMVVGEDVVPLIPGPPARSGACATTLLLAVGRGVRREVWFSKPEGLEVAIDSDDLLIGEMPTRQWPHGWIAFPHTDATVPCIHDFNDKGRRVALVHGEEFPGLAASWSCTAEDVAITNVPPVAADIYGHFAKDVARSVSYAVDHPRRLNGTPVVFEQTVRFCPRIGEDDDPDDGDGGGGGESGYHVCHCSDGADCTCCREEWCHCRSWRCPCNANRVPALSEDDGDAEEAFANMVAGSGLRAWPNVLYLHRDNSRTERLEVPGGSPRKCCPCPEHWASNYVGLAYKSVRLSVAAPDGSAFGTAYEPCDVRISGVSPSRAFGDATLLFVTNRASYRRLDCTVLGVGIDSPKGTAPLSEYNRLSTSLGYPVEVATEMSGSRPLVLRTDVLLDGGIVRVALEGATSGMEVWLPAWWDNRGDHHAPERLLDATTRTERFIPMRRWRNLMARYGSERSLEVRILSPTEGSATLAFEYRASEDGFYVDDHARQRITAIDPVLLTDYDRDGEIGDEDVLRHAAGREAYFWRNDDRWRGDDAFESNMSANSSNTTVDGRNDLINLLPIAVDVATLASHWGAASVRYRLEADDWSLRKAQLTLADIGWSDIGDAPLGECSDIDGTAIHEAPVFALGEGADLPPAFVSLSKTRRSTLLMEFPEEARDASLRLNAYSVDTDTLLFSARLPLHVGDVAQMIGWENLRGAAGGSGGPATDHATPDWPDSEHEEGTVVFVHGYNMEEDREAPLWAKNVFKKLWWSGLDRRFVAVQWRGNEGQTYVEVPFVGYVTPNYYGNVQNAFATAAALKAAMDGIRGPKWFIAHSLGNMLVSAAIQDYGMPHERYFMLNAAVPMEAYSAKLGVTKESHDNMTSDLWVNYADRVRATHWFERFPEGDGRRLLTWKDRFASVTNVVNFYSTQEDVVCNGDGKYRNVGRHYAWYIQETNKGLWSFMLHQYEGGWAFNPYYDTVTMQWNGSEFVEIRRRMSPQNAANLGDDQLRQHPFFLDFANPEMYTSPNGEIVATNYLYRAEMLAYAIPAESYAAGANPLPNLSSEELNIDMAGFTEGQADLPENGKKVEEHYRDWQHSTLVQRSYKRTRQLFRKIMEIIRKGK